MLIVWQSLFAREWRLAHLRQAEGLTVWFFFVITVSLFPLAVGPEPHMLKTIAPGILWVAALLAALLSLQRLFQADVDDGSWEQMRLAVASPVIIVVVKVFVHWLRTGLPLIILAPVLALQFGLPFDAIVVLVVTLLLGTPVLSLVGALGAALIVNLNGANALLALLVLPLCIPVLIFGAGAVDAASAGLPINGHLSLLGALLILTAIGAPWATTAALKISTE